MPTHRLLSSLVASTLLVTAGACGDNERRPRSLTIEPLDAQLCANDDESQLIEGMQHTVVVHTDGFRSGDSVTLSVLADGGATQTLTVQDSMSDGSDLAFSGFNLPEGTVILQASSGDVSSLPVTVTVSTSPPEMTFLAPRPGTQPDTISGLNDLDPSTLSVDYEVVVQTDIEDGGEISLTVQPETGAAVDIGPTDIVGGMAIWQVPFNQPGLWTLTVEGVNGCGNMGTQTVDVFVDMEAPGDCIVSLDPTPLDIGTRSVLNASIDDPAQAGFQAGVSVDAGEPGVTVRLYLNDTEQASMVTGATGVATFDLDLPEDPDLELRASCTDGSGNVSDSLPQSLLVDITPPVCTIEAPADGSFLAGTTPPLQFDVDVTVAGTGDVDGETVEATVGGTSLPDQTIVGGMATFADATVSSAGSVDIAMLGVDHAGNTCVDVNTVTVDLDGCTIEITSPTSTVFTDADANGANGVQLDVVVTTTSAGCFGQPVQLTNCSANGSAVNGTFSATGTATLTTTFCASAQCDQTRTCTATTTESGSAIVSSDQATLRVDNLPPVVTMSIVQPAVACGSTITPASDIDATTAGVQVRVRQFSAVTDKRFQVTPAAGSPVEYVADGSGFADVTVAAGTNTIVAIASDASGTGTSTPCTLTVSTLGVAITDPLNGETLGTADGTVSGTDLVIQVCGTVTDASATVIVTVNGAGMVTATVTGTTWCASGVTVPSGGPTTIQASGSTAGGDNGSHSIMVFVDLSPPDPPTALLLSQANRRTVQVDFTEPGDLGGAPVDHCVIKSSTIAIPDGPTFEALGGGRTVAGTAAGSMRSETFSPLRIGPSNARFWAVRCYDDAGNASTVTAAGPFELNFESGPEITPAGATGDTDYGVAMAAADLDNDGVDDLIVGAPTLSRDGGASTQGRVYVYMGVGATGITGTPDFIVDTTALDFFSLGQGITRIDWNADGVDDVAMSAPYAGGFQGEVYVFYGGAAAWTPGSSTTTLTTADADVVIGLGTGGGFDPSVALQGWSLAAANFDGTGGQDLVIGTQGYGGFKGGAIVLFGGSTASSITIPDTLGAAGTKAYFFSFGAIGPSPGFGTAVAGLGAISGAGDTREDIAVSQGPDLDAGWVAIFYGRAQPSADFQVVDGTTAEEQITPEAEADGLNAFGERIGSMQDLNGDGRRELLVAARRWGLEQGRVYVIPIGNWTSGPPLVKPAGSSATIIFQGTTNQFVGSALGNPGIAKGRADIDGDDIDDFLIGYAGGLLAYFGANGLAGTFDVAAAADVVVNPASWLGVNNALWAGDLDNDGLEDVVQGEADISPTPSLGALQPLY